MVSIMLSPVLVLLLRRLRVTRASSHTHEIIEIYIGHQEDAVGGVKEVTDANLSARDHREEEDEIQVGDSTNESSGHDDQTGTQDPHQIVKGHRHAHLKQANRCYKTLGVALAVI